MLTITSTKPKSGTKNSSVNQKFVLEESITNFQICTSFISSQELIFNKDQFLLDSLIHM